MYEYVPLDDPGCSITRILRQPFRGGLAPSLDSHGGETANDSTILAIISLPLDVDYLLVFKVFVSLSQLVLFSLHVRESWN